MDLIDNKRLYQRVALTLKQRIESGFYQIGTKMPAERLIAEEMDVSRTVVREAIIMLEVEDYVSVKKGSGIHVISNMPKNGSVDKCGLEFAKCGPFELLQARQLIESNIAEFAATQITKEDIVKLLEIQHNAQKEDHFRDSEWDLEFHVQVAAITRNTALITVIKEMWSQRLLNPYWRKLHDHVDTNRIESWHTEHENILKALIKKDPNEAKFAMWQHLENTKQMLFNATNDDFEVSKDKYMFSENPVVTFDKIVEDDYLL